MKKFILTCFLFSFVGITYSQKYQPIDSTLILQTRNNKRISSAFCCYVYEDASFQYHGFELNNGNKWLKLFKSAAYSLVPCATPCTSGIIPTNFTNLFVGYVLNDSLNKKVYFTPTLTANFTPVSYNIIYDFNNKTVGDSLAWRSVSYFGYANIDSSQKFKILAIDSILFTGKYHKRYTVQNTSIFITNPVSVVEGIGSTRGSWNSVFTDFEQGSSLTCFSKPQQAMSVSNFTTFNSMPSAFCATISTVPELEAILFSVHPNPANNTIQIKGIEVNSVLIYDSFGKLLIETKEVKGSVNVSELKSGVYFLKMRSGERTYTSKFIRE